MWEGVGGITSATLGKRHWGCSSVHVLIIITIIIKRISRAPIYHTRWQHRALYNNTNHTHTASDEGMGRDVSGKNVLNSMIIKISM